MAETPIIRTVTLTDEDRDRVWKIVTERYSVSGGSLVETFTGIAAEYALLKEALDNGEVIMATYHEATMQSTKKAWLEVKFSGAPR